MSNSNKDKSNTLDFDRAVEEMNNNFRHVEDLIKMFAETNQSADPDQFHLKEAYAKWFTEASKNPEKVMTDSIVFWQKSMQLTQQVLANAFSNEEDGDKLEPVITEEKGDRRFKHEDWTEKSVFSLIKQSYLLSSEFMRNMVTDVEGLDEKTAEKVKFFTERYLDSMSPTNFAASNPAVIEKVIETKGENLINGFKNLLADIDEGSGQLKISMTDTTAFTLGENIASTPGNVVFQNKMFQLIQYSPSTEKVLKRPLLIVPPWINKFYVLDLQEKNSMLKWMVDQGHTVFIISWINPDETYKEIGFEDYVTEGVITAVDAIEQATGENEVNAIGYCIGGTLLSIALAFMKAKDDSRIKTATFFTTMIDFSNLGELGVFIDEEQITGIEKVMTEEGFLKGTRMSSSFNLLRANDLIWSFYINNYLLGNDPRPFDLLYWNSDSTRMTPTMHSWYLRNMYQHNNLIKPNKISIKGTSIDISSIDIPACFVGAVEDHIAPWLSTYSGAKLLAGDTRFILAGSGHIAGIVNPPDANKYEYRVTDELPDDSQAWADNAEITEGSWWPNWDSWIRTQASESVKARVEGEGGLELIEAAPGAYVKCKVDDPSPVVECTKLDPTKKPSLNKKTAIKQKLNPLAQDSKKTQQKKAKSSAVKVAAEIKLPSSQNQSNKKAKAATKIIDKKLSKAVSKAASKMAKKEEAASKSNISQKTHQTIIKNEPAPKKQIIKSPSAKPIKDDLTIIKGIGPKIAELLHTVEINKYADIAKLSAKQIQERMVAVDLKNKRFDTSTWPSQAKELMVKTTDAQGSTKKRGKK